MTLRRFVSLCLITSACAQAPTHYYRVVNRAFVDTGTAVVPNPTSYLTLCSSPTITEATPCSTGYGCWMWPWAGWPNYVCKNISDWTVSPGYVPPGFLIPKVTMGGPSGMSITAVFGDDWSGNGFSTFFAATKPLYSSGCCTGNAFKGYGGTGFVFLLGGWGAQPTAQFFNDGVYLGGVSQSTPFNQGGWNSFAITCAPNGVATYYANGVLQGSVTLAGGSHPFATATKWDNMYPGQASSSQDNGYSMNGVWQEIRTYDYVLAASQITALPSVPPPSPPMLPSPPPPPPPSLPSPPPPTQLLAGNSNPALVPNVIYTVRNVSTYFNVAKAGLPLANVCRKGP